MTSSTAHGVMAVNSWILPPAVGYNTAVLQGAVKTSSAFNFANLTAKAVKCMGQISVTIKLLYPMNSCSLIYECSIFE